MEPTLVLPMVAFWVIGWSLLVAVAAVARIRQIERMKENYKPRPTERIPRIVFLLAQAWEADPDQRLGQLLVNLSRNEDGSIRDIWHIEDDEWERRLRPVDADRQGDGESVG